MLQCVPACILEVDMDSVEIDYDDVVHETPLAVLVDIDGDGLWIPKSVMLPGFEASDECSSCRVKEWRYPYSKAGIGMKFKQYRRTQIDCRRGPRSRLSKGRRHDCPQSCQP